MFALRLLIATLLAFFATLGAAFTFAENQYDLTLISFLAFCLNAYQFNSYTSSRGRKLASQFSTHTKNF